MGPLRIKPYLLRLYLAVVVLFVLNKLVVRPAVLGHGAPTWLQAVVLSVPNAFEAVVGMANVACVLVAAKLALRPRLDRVPNPAIYLLTAALVGAYVLAQEARLHDLGGRNVHDPIDAVASVAGIGAMVAVLWRWGSVERVDREGPHVP